MEMHVKRALMTPTILAFIAMTAGTAQAQSVAPQNQCEKDFYNGCVQEVRAKCEAIPLGRTAGGQNKGAARQRCMNKMQQAVQQCYNGGKYVCQ